MIQRSCPTVERFASGEITFFSSKTANVIFPDAFHFVPRIVVTATGADSNARYWTESIDVNGFVLKLNINSSASFQWIALDL